MSEAISVPAADLRGPTGPQGTSRSRGSAIPVVLLLASALVAYDQLPWMGTILVGAFVVVLAGIALVVREPDRRDEASATLFAMLVPLAPALGGPLLLCLSLLFVARSARGRFWAACAWAAPYLGLVLAWVVAQAIVTVDLPKVRSVVSWAWSHGTDDVVPLVARLRLHPPHVVDSWLSLSRVAVLLLLFQLLRESHARVRGFRRGLVLGTGVAVVVTALQVAVVLPPLPNQHIYWRMLSRYPGTFADPNAFGLFALVALMLLADAIVEARGWSRSGLVVLAAALLALAAFSGSRTYFVGLGIYALLGVLRRGSRTVAVIAVAAALSMVALHLGPRVSETSLEPYLPIGVKRFVSTVTPSTMVESVASRMAFLRIAIHTWRQNPLLGAGFNRFALFAPRHSQALSLSTGRWTDNANNFYLGVLAETGILGFALLAWCLSRLRFREDAHPGLRDALVTFAVVLLLGPHLEFDEVVALVALLIAATLEPARWLPGPRAVAAITLVVLPILVVQARAIDPLPARGELVTFGFHDKEVAGTGRVVMWTERVAALVFPRPKGRLLSIHMADGLPGKVATEPLDVDVWVDGKQLDRVRVPRGRGQRFDWFVPAASSGPMVVRLEASRAFTPAAALELPDWRELGVAIEHIAFSPIAPGKDYGLLTPFQQEGRRIFRPSSGRQVILAPGRGKKLLLRLATRDPSVAARPLRLQIRVHGGRQLDVELSDDSWKQVVVPLHPDRRNIVTIVADRAHVPREVGAGNDRRFLSFLVGPYRVYP